MVRTGAKRWMLDLTLRAPVDFQQTECDTGVVQFDSLRLDEAETVRRAAAFYAGFDARVAAERDLLRSMRPSLIVGDVPPLAFAAARAAGVPSIAIANFTWDWIYEGYEPERFGATDLVRRSGRPTPRPTWRSGCRCGAASSGAAGRHARLAARRAALRSATRSKRGTRSACPSTGRWCCCRSAATG